MRTHNKACLRPWHSIARISLRATVLAALLSASLASLAAQDFQESAPDVPAEQPDTLTAPEYSGPAVLSRSSQPRIGQGSEFATLQPFLYFNQSYQSSPNAGLSGGGTPDSSLGMGLGIGLTGTRHWKRAMVSVQYEGNYQRYSEQSTLVGTNQFLNLTATMPFRRRFLFSFRQTAGTSRQDFGTLLLQPSFLASDAPLPTNQPFNSGVKFLDSMWTAVYQKSHRLSFSFSADESLMREQYSTLIGTNATTARADVNYQLTPRTTIGADYTFEHYGFTTFGSADFQVASLDYAWRISRTVDVAVQLGTAHGSVQSLAELPIDPGIATILGTGTGLQISNRVINTPSYGARVSKRWYHASADVGYQRGVSPGNGLVLTSTAETVNAGFHYAVRNYWTFSVAGGWTTLDALGSGTSRYSSYTGDVNIGHSIRPGLDTFARFEVRPFSYAGVGTINRTSYIAEIGLTFSPKPLPIVLR